MVSRQVLSLSILLQCCNIVAAFDRYAGTIEWGIMTAGTLESPLIAPIQWNVVARLDEPPRVNLFLESHIEISSDQLVFDTTVPRTQIGAVSLLPTSSPTTLTTANRLWAPSNLPTSLFQVVDGELVELPTVVSLPDISEADHGFAVQVKIEPETSPFFAIVPASAPAAITYPGRIENGSELGWTGFAIRDLVQTEFKLQFTPPGDITGDGRVAFDDFLVLSGQFGTLGGGWEAGDFNLDGATGFDDFLTLSGNFGVDESESAAVPEPGGFMSLTVGLVMALCRGRKNR